MSVEQAKIRKHLVIYEDQCNYWFITWKNTNSWYDLHRYQEAMRHRRIALKVLLKIQTRDILLGHSDQGEKDG